MRNGLFSVESRMLREMSSVITFKERGFYLKQAHGKWGECVCVVLLKVIVMEQTSHGRSALV